MRQLNPELSIVITASGRKRADRRHRLAHPAQDQRRPRQHLGHPGDRQIGERHEAVEPFRRHPLAADPGDAQTTAGALAQRRDQRRPERVARWLAGDDEQKRRRGAALAHRDVIGR